jgi:ATP-dependent DNA helicase RecG
MRLNDPLSKSMRLSDQHEAALTRLGIQTVRDLLYHFPFRYDISGDEVADNQPYPGRKKSRSLARSRKMETKKSWQRRIPISEGYLRDQTGRVKLRWFNQPYIAKMYQDGALVKAVGKVTGTGDKMYLANPRLERVMATDVGLFKKDLSWIAPEK